MQELECEVGDFSSCPSLPSSLLLLQSETLLGPPREGWGEGSHGYLGAGASGNLLAVAAVSHQVET